MSYEGDPKRDPRVDIITEDVIAEIAKDAALEQLQYVADIELTMNEKLTESQNAQVEVQKFQTQVDDLKRRISIEKQRVTSVHDPLIQMARNDLDTAKQNEKQKYAEYMTVQNKISDINAQIDYFQTLHDSHPYTIQAIMDLVNINNLKMELNALAADNSNTWLRYLDAQAAKETAERNYNNALLAKQNDSRDLDQLERELIAATNSLNTWRIAYQAATNVYNELKIQLAQIKSELEG